MVGGVNKENMESKFKVGDRVRVVSAEDICNMSITMGMTGTVLDITTEDLGIKFDQIIRGHNLMPDYEHVRKNGWYMRFDEVELIGNDIHTDIHTDIQSLKDKYPQFNITVSVEEKV